MSTTATETATFRTFESFEIHWADNARWTGYDTAAEAQAVVDSPRVTRAGEVVRRTWEVQLRPTLLAMGMYQPGCGDRTEVVS